MINKIKNLFLVAAAAVALGSCQKIDQPELGEVVTDENQNLPSGPLRFFASFNKTDGPSPRWNAADSISGSPALLFPLSFTQGINGNAVQGADDAAILYLNTNDFNKATSFTIAFWFKRAVNDNTEFLFSLKDDRVDWSKSAIFMMAEHATPTAATIKVFLLGQWLEFPRTNQLKKPFFDGNWHHWAMVYDETTSKMSYYFDGQLVTDAPASATDVKKGSSPRGALDLTTANNLIIGGNNQHADVAGATDSWMKSYQGAIDQFRMYNKVLTPAEIQALFAGKL